MKGDTKENPQRRGRASIKSYANYGGAEATSLLTEASGVFQKDGVSNILHDSYISEEGFSKDREYSYTDGLEDPSSEFELSTTLKIILGMSHSCVMAALGFIVISLEINLLQFAQISHCYPTRMSSALLSRAAGSMLGSFLGSKVISCCSPQFILMTTMIFISALLFLIPFLSNVGIFEAVYFGFGLLIPISEAAVQFLTCRVHNSKAGLWLQANNVAMWCAPVVVPLLHFYLGLVQEYFFLGGFASFVIFLLAWVPADKKLMKHFKRSVAEPSAQSSDGEIPNRVQVAEIVIAMILFLVYGSVVQTTSFIRLYIEEMGVVPLENSDFVIVVFLGSAMIGQAISLRAQSSFSMTQLFYRVIVLLVNAVLAMAAIIHFSHSAAVFWVSMGLFGFCIGPVSGYCFDLWHRMCVVSQLGSAMIVFGAYIGSGVSPFLTLLVWNRTDFPQILIIGNMICCFVSLLLTFVACFLAHFD